MSKSKKDIEKSLIGRSENSIKDILEKYLIKFCQNKCKPKCKPIKKIPFTISSPGYYALTNNVSTNMTSGNAITINASDVVLDLQDFTITGITDDVNIQSIGIYSYDNENVLIKNGIIRGFKNAIYLASSFFYPPDPQNSRMNVIENIKAIKSRSTAVLMAGDRNILRNCVINDSIGFGVYAWYGSPVIENNKILNVDYTEPYQVSVGIGLFESYGGLIKNNLISHVDKCISLPGDGPVLDLVILDNQFTESNTGIYIDVPGYGDIVVCKYVNTITSGVLNFINNPDNAGVESAGINN